MSGFNLPKILLVKFQAGNEIYVQRMFSLLIAWGKEGTNVYLVDKFVTLVSKELCLYDLVGYLSRRR